MRFHLLHVGHRSATFECENGFPATAPWEHQLLLNGVPRLTTRENVFTVDDLKSNMAYTAELRTPHSAHHVQFETRQAAHVVNIRDFGAVAAQHVDNTAAINAAIAASPPDTVVEFPDGEWLTGPIFLRSRVHLVLAPGARIVGHPDVARWPVLPPHIEGGGSPSLVVGSWEGRPEVMHAALITGIDVHDVSITGAGCIDGNATFESWWSRPKGLFVGRRPRTIYIAHGTQVVVAGVRLMNSPSWTVHPFFCHDVKLLDLRIEAPEQSPNTDGINPESSRRVRIAGARISTGDDCIAIKSGRITEPSTPFDPTQGVEISNCVLYRGHAAIALGSEMSGGIYDVSIRDSCFVGTERGLRIKTRRGRGRTAVIRGVHMKNVRMEAVGTPFVINSFYHCDPDGHTPYVSDRAPRPVDAGTPRIEQIEISGLSAQLAQHSAGYVLGLPESPVRGLTLRDYEVSLDENATPGFPDKADSIGAVARAGLFLCNVEGLELQAVNVRGQLGPQIVTENVS